MEVQVAVADEEELAVGVLVAVSDSEAPREGALAGEAVESGVEGAGELWGGEAVTDTEEVTLALGVRTCTCACTRARAARRRRDGRDAAEGIVLMWVWGRECQGNCIVSVGRPGAFHSPGCRGDSSYFAP